MINPIREIYLMKFREQDFEREIEHLQLLKTLERSKARKEVHFTHKVNRLLHVLANLRKVRVKVSFVYADSVNG